MKRFHPDVRLKRMLAAPGGVPSSVALQKASENLESLRASGRDEIVSKIAQLAALRAGTVRSSRDV